MALERLRAMSAVDTVPDLVAILREYLREQIEQHLTTLAPECGACALGLMHTGLVAEQLEELRRLHGLRDDRNWSHITDRLMQQHGLPHSYRDRLGLGVLEAEIKLHEEALRRAHEGVPLVLPPDEAPALPSPPQPLENGPPVPPPPVSGAPTVSILIDPHFVRREKIDGARHQVMAQERGTLRRFVEVCGERPVDAYNRGDITGFLDTLRKLPTTYGKSPKDKDRPLAEIIAAADAKGAERLEDKTVKRHLSALSQFFQYAVDLGHLTVSARTELVGGHRFAEQRRARAQRGAWTSDELKRLFDSPVWRGCASEHRRSEPGPLIIRDARFWLPILALYHGARLEEFADLYRRDLGRDGEVWFLKITEEGGRSLKTGNAERVLPLHPELNRLGFVEYVQKIAPSADDPLFPDLPPQGQDKRRGPRITRWFVEYRRAIKVYRPGVGMHAFRHVAITRLRDAMTDAQQDRHIDFLMGHARSGEGRARYDKGPGLREVAETLALLRHPEVDLSHLHARGRPA